MKSYILKIQQLEGELMQQKFSPTCRNGLHDRIAMDKDMLLDHLCSGCEVGTPNAASAIAISVANSTVLVKVRVKLQAEGKLAPGVPRRYAGGNGCLCQDCLEGVAALWIGLGPNVARNAVINAAELSSYDQVKRTILKLPGFKDDVVTHLFAGLGAGFFVVCVSSPVDVHDNPQRQVCTSQKNMRINDSSRILESNVVCSKHSHRAPVIYCIRSTDGEKRRLAKVSLAYNCESKKCPHFRKLFPEYVEKYNQKKQMEQTVAKPEPQENPAPAPSPAVQQAAVIPNNGGKPVVDRRPAAKRSRRSKCPSG